MSYSIIQTALFKDWQAQDFALPTYYPGRNETPINDHIQLIFLPVSNRVASMGADGSNEVIGILQADVMYRTGRGTGEILTITDAIVAAYPSGRHIVEQGQDVTIWGAEPSQPRTDGGWQKISISINFTAYVRRST